MKWPAGLVVPALALVVLASRLQAIRLATELNPDEGQVMALAMRVARAPIPWKGVDGTTCGPLNTWFLYGVHTLGLPLSYTGVHALAAGMLVAITLLAYAALRAVTSPLSAALGGGVTALIIALSQGANFTQFGSELVPALITCVVALLIVLGERHPRARGALGWLAALLVGVLPWTKLQATPGAVVLAVWLLRGTAARARAWALLAVMALPSIVILGVVIAVGAWSEFWHSYVVANEAYVGGSGPLLMAKRLVHLLGSPTFGAVLCTGSLGALWLGWGAPGWERASAALRRCLVAGAALAVATTFAVLVPRVPFPHYQILLIPPLGLLSGCVLEAWRAAHSPARGTRVVWPAFALGVVGALLLAGPSALRDARAMHALAASVNQTPQRQIARAILAAAPRAKTMAVWGWMPSVYIESGLTPATRDAVCHFVIDPGPAREFMQAGYLADVQRERPDVVVDAVADGCFRWGWSVEQGLHSFPALAELVEREYRLVSELHIDGGQAPVRVYVSRAYLAEHARP